MADDRKDKGEKGGKPAAPAGKAAKTEKPAKAAKPGKPAAAGGAPAIAMERPTGPKEKPRLAKYYDETVRPALMKHFKYSSVMQAPRFRKIVVNMGVGDGLQDQKLIDAAMNELTLIAGQRPAVRRAKKAISNFKLREGVPIGAKVTLRGARMYEFLDRLINVALPRVRDFRGVPPKGFDGRGNYALGLREQLIFPEIVYDKIDKVRGMDISIVTTARTDEDAKVLLTHLGMPFRE